MLNIGDSAPDFSLPQTDTGPRTLRECFAGGPVLLYFYPADFTRGCTSEACSIRDLHTDLQAVGLNVAGVSPQSPDSHSRFRDKHALPFALLADEKKTVVRMYDVNGPLGFGVQRATFLIDPSRVIRDVIVANFRIAEHEAFVQKCIALAEGGRN